MDMATTRDTIEAIAAAMPEEQVFDFYCDARIGVSILAHSLEAAKEEWHRICASIEVSDDIHNKAGDQFYVWVAQQDPEIECDGKELTTE
jgi:hypothetical protein